MIEIYVIENGDSDDEFRQVVGYNYIYSNLKSAKDRLIYLYDEYRFFNMEIVKYVLIDDKYKLSEEYVYDGIKFTKHVNNNY